jgi:hypothetical protein
MTIVELPMLRKDQLKIKSVNELVRVHNRVRASMFKSCAGLAYLIRTPERL